MCDFFFGSALLKTGTKNKVGLAVSNCVLTYTQKNTTQIKEHII